MKRIKVALVGNPNVGKTAIMNALAGTNEKVGNWPGVTVQKKTGIYNFRGFEIELIDLPGIYSLSSYTLEERVARNFLLSGDYDVVCNIVDATLLGRNLYLTLELLEMGIKPVIALNKIDELENYGYSIDVKKLEKILNLPVIEVSAIKRKGLEELSETFLMVFSGDLKVKGIVPKYPDFLENAIRLVTLKLKNLQLKNLPFNIRWFSIKLLERDPEVIEFLKKNFQNSEEVLKEIDNIESEAKKRFNIDLPSLISKERFKLASKIAKEVIKSGVVELPQEKLSDKIDKFVTNPLTGIPLFFFIMWLVFKITFDLSSPISDWIDEIFSNFFPNLINEFFNFLPKMVISLINNGILAGLGAVMVFIPVLGILYFLMSILEDTGYMARAAALWDNFMRIFGLNGSSVIPMILGFGCNVPAIYATRAMRSPIQRLITMAVIPWMSCSARLTVYTVFVSAFFKENKSIVILSLYMLGIFLALGLAAVMSKFLRGNDEEFFIELPPYKLPAWNVVLNQTWIELREFVLKAGTIIFVISVLIWVLASLPPGVDYAGENSLIGKVGNLLLPLFSPLGIHDWKPIVALIFGALAKEIVVGTLGTLYGTGESGLIKTLQSTFTPESAVAYLVFTLLYIPCAATIAAIRQESGSWRFTLLVIGIELSVAWAMAFTVYHLADLIT
ncbi:MAG: ferrous iron transport protein B [Thermovibrio sp.]|nr:MAG: ferrous iron transport protein B [Thermovibrio sp.]